MDVHSIKAALHHTLHAGVDVYERRPGAYQLILPIRHEDGDMVDVYLQDSPRGEGYVRICDYGLTLMRLSCTYTIDTDSRRRIFDGILINNDVGNDGGNLYLDTPPPMLSEGILQFAGCVQKICNMRFWSREVVRSAFYDDLGACMATGLARFSPIADVSPLPDYPATVDWSLSSNDRTFYVFGVRGNDKAKVVAIALLEFQKAGLPFISLVVHEDMEELGRKERLYLTRNADTQYPLLCDFTEKAAADIDRLAGVAA